MTTLKIGDRVKLPKHPASAPNTTYWYGTWTGQTVEWDDEIPDHWGRPSKGNEIINYGLAIA